MSETDTPSLANAIARVGRALDSHTDYAPSLREFATALLAEARKDQPRRLNEHPKASVTDPDIDKLEAILALVERVRRLDEVLAALDNKEKP